MTRPTPPLPDGLFEYTYTDDEDGEVVTCHMEFHPAENVCGRDFKAGASLWMAYKSGAPFIDEITSRQLHGIEKDALKEYLSK